MARDLLGHASLHTTNTYYNQARSIEASRLYSTFCRPPEQRRPRIGLSGFLLKAEMLEIEQLVEPRQRAGVQIQSSDPPKLSLTI